ncbi:MAG TPA: alpha/beta fold hydrolase [Pyrinomonadaceae bacterium]
MTEDRLEKFLTATTQDRLRLVFEPETAEEVKRYLGQAAFEEYLALARRAVRKLGESHLGLNSPTNLLFVPGVMGSLLLSRTKGGIWWIDVRTRKHIDDLKLAPDGQADADPRHQIIPCTVDTSYEAFLTAILERDDFGHELFPYDWRKPVTASADAFRNQVQQLYDSNGNQKVHLVAHSMGGLVVRAALMLYGKTLWPMVGRIVFIGTPHYGSPSIAGYLKNHLWGFDLMAALGLYLGRETFRSLWGVLNLLPAPAGVYPGTRPDDEAPWTINEGDDVYLHPCANFDMYRAEDWKLDLSPAQSSQLQKILDETHTFHTRMYEAHQNLDQSYRDRMAIIAGVGYKTLFRLAYQKRFWGFWEKTEKVTAAVAGDPHRQGDGRVPVASASLENVGETRYVKGVHGGLPMIPQVYEDVFRWLKEEPMSLPSTMAQALSQHLSLEPESETPNLDGTARSDALTGDPGFWDFEPPDEARLAAIKEQLDKEQLPEFIKVRLL